MLQNTLTKFYLVRFGYPFHYGEAGSLAEDETKVAAGILGWTHPLLLSNLFQDSYPILWLFDSQGRHTFLSHGVNDRNSHQKK